MSALREPQKRAKKGMRTGRKPKAPPEHEKITRGVVGRPGTSEATKTGDWRVFYPEFDMEQCIRCGKCLENCPDAAIREQVLQGKAAEEAKKRADELEKAGKIKKAAAKKAHIRYQLNPEYCKGCGICANECPIKGIKMKLEEK
ncbi:MAG: 4Fe-4S binding protein [Halobacteriota archaeon]